MVSIVIPTYNRCELLLRAVRSVLGQTFEQWELIVVDDGSTDDTKERIQALEDSRILYLSQEQAGVSAARNRGIAEASFEWLAFLDSDDEWELEKLERQVEATQERIWARVSHTDEIWFRRGRRVNPRKKHRKYGGWIYHRCLPLCAISPSSVMIHRTIFDDVGPFDEDLPVCEDYDLWLRICCRYPVFFLDEPLVRKYGGHEDQLSQSRWGMDRFRVAALEKRLHSDDLWPQARIWTAREIIRKARILRDGARKRDKPPARWDRVIAGARSHVRHVWPFERSHVGTLERWNVWCVSRFRGGAIRATALRSP